MFGMSKEVFLLVDALVAILRANDAERASTPAEVEDETEDEPGDDAEDTNTDE